MYSQDSPIRIVQISDPHLFANKSGGILGMNTEDSFQAVMQLVEREQPAIDLILATGDISQDGSIEAYTHFEQRVQKLDAPLYWLPGNHDNLENMQSVIQHPDQISPFCIDVRGWSIVMLNSAVPGEVPGELDESELDFLRKTLREKSNRHVLVTLHHHPVKMQSKWLDSVALKNPERFWEIIKEFSEVKSVVWGHVHQEYVSSHFGVQCFSPPSTCIQFKPRSAEFALDTRSPGYRWLDLMPDGRVETGVSRVEDQVFTVDLNGTGY